MTDFIFVWITNTKDHKQYVDRINITTNQILITESLVTVYQTIIMESSPNRQLDTFMSMVVLIF